MNVCDHFTVSHSVIIALDKDFYMSCDSCPEGQVLLMSSGTWVFLYIMRPIHPNGWSRSLCKSLVPRDKMLRKISNIYLRKISKNGERAQHSSEDVKETHMIPVIFKDKQDSCIRPWMTKSSTSISSSSSMPAINFFFVEFSGYLLQGVIRTKDWQGASFQRRKLGNFAILWR